MRARLRASRRLHLVPQRVEAGEVDCAQLERRVGGQLLDGLEPGRNSRGGPQRPGGLDAEVACDVHDGEEEVAELFGGRVGLAELLDELAELLGDLGSAPATSSQSKPTDAAFFWTLAA